MSRHAATKWEGLDAKGLAKRWGRARVVPFGKVDSTNDAAKELAETDAPAGTVVVCREQTAGRGRAGKRWASPPGRGVYLSAIFRPRDLAHPAPLSILAGLGVVRALDDRFSGLGPKLKWPNDVIVADRKCGGILAEAAWSEAVPRYLVVGVGINVRPLPKGTPAAIRRGAGSLEEALGRSVPLLDVADGVVEGLDMYLSDPPVVLEAPLLAVLDRYDWLRDRRVRLTPPGEESVSTGVCVGIAPDGALLFRPDRGALRRVENAIVEPEA